MKKRSIIVVSVCAAVLLALAVFLLLPRGEKSLTNPDNAENIGRLLTHLVEAYESPNKQDAQTIEADLAAIRAVSQKDYTLAKSIADHWRSVFLDPDYSMYLYQGDDTAPELAEAGIPNSRSHAIVVLGYELKNGQMQPELMGRCEAAAAAAKAFPETILVCSGGATGGNNPGGNTEAGLMKAYLIEHCGIDASRIFADEKAMTTAENAVNTFEILQENKVHTMTIVTSAYHMRWGQAVYHLLAELYREQRDYSIESIANYCYYVEPSVEAYRAGDRFAACQIAGILKLPNEVIRSLPPVSPAEPAEEKQPEEQDNERPDYSDPANWAYNGIGADKAADLFLICPTVDMNDEFNMALDDEETKASFLGALNMERGIYEESTRMFAPYYRQAAMKVYSLEPDQWEPYMALAYSDVSAAFAYYLEHENQGRPIILAGFSQGADMCYRLLAEYFGDEALEEQLIAVYAIGWPCTAEMTEKNPQIRPAGAADDIGVVISFDCEAPEVGDTFINPAGQKAYAINPLNWRTDGTAADRSENLGACFTDYSGEIRSEQAELCGCYIEPERGVLKVTDVDPTDYAPVVPGLPDGAYHVYDYLFFFRNLQENVAERIAAFAAARTLEPAA